MKIRHQGPGLGQVSIPLGSFQSFKGPALYGKQGHIKSSHLKAPVDFMILHYPFVSWKVEENRLAMPGFLSIHPISSVHCFFWILQSYIHMGATLELFGLNYDFSVYWFLFQLHFKYKFEQWLLCLRTLLKGGY